MLTLFEEGKAKFYASKGEISSELEVFYNPMMKLNRDVSVWLVSQLKTGKICDSMAASGVRSIRLALEAGASDILANDVSKSACEAIQRNILLNNVEGRVKASNHGVRLLFGFRMFDYIDIDPFGCPSPYAESALHALNPNGIIAITATDTSCLCGRYPKACERKYGARSMLSGFSKETGIRIMVWMAQRIALEQGKSLEPIFVHSSNHYLRAYLRHNTHKTAEDIESQTGCILYCHKCLSTETSKEIGKMCCGRKMDYAGPLWLGSLWDDSLAEKFTLIPYIREESRIKAVGFYDTHAIARALRKEAVKIDYVMQKLAEKGYESSRTHFKPEGIRTLASIKEIAALY